MISGGNKKRKNISAFSSILTTLLLSMMGIWVAPKLIVQPVPTPDTPSFTLSFSWPDRSANNVEQYVTSRLESNLSTLQGLTQIYSRSSSGQGEVVLEFDKYKNLDEAKLEVYSIIRQIYPSLPPGISYPNLTIDNPDNTINQPISVYVITTDSSYQLAEKSFQKILIQPLSLLNGIYEVKVEGINRWEIRITLDGNLLHALAIPQEKVTAGIAQQLEKYSIGKVIYQRSPQTLVSQISTYNQALDVESIKQIPIAKIQNRIITLSQIGQIHVRLIPPRSFFRVNGAKTLTVSIYPKEHINELLLQFKIDKLIEKLHVDLAPEFGIEKKFDRTEAINEELQKISFRALIIAVVLIGFIFLNTRSIIYSLLVLGVTLSQILIAVNFYYLLNVNIHVYSIAAIAISLGIMIDNNILMVDHWIHQRKTRITMAIVAANLTTITSLVVFFFLEEEIKVKFTDFATVIMINLSISMIMARILIPAFISQIRISQSIKVGFRHRRRMVSIRNGYFSLISFIYKRRKMSIALLILAFGVPIYLLPKRISPKIKWAEIYNSILGSPSIRPYIDNFSGGVSRIFFEDILPNMHFGEPRNSKLRLKASLPFGSDITLLDQAFKDLETFLGQFEEIRGFQARINSPQSAFIEITFKKEFERKSFPFRLKKQLFAKAMTYAGIDWGISGIGTSFSNHSPMYLGSQTIKIYGYDYYKLKRFADHLNQYIIQFPRILESSVVSKNTTIFEDNYDYQITWNEKYLMHYGLTSQQIISEMENLSGISTFNSPHLSSKFSRITTQAKASSSLDVWRLKNMPIPLDSVSRIILSEQLEITRKLSESEINKENQRYVLFLVLKHTADQYYLDNNIGKFVDVYNQQLPLGFTAQYPWPKGKLSGQDLWIVLVPICIIFVICASLLESLRLPFIIISIIPISFMGIPLIFRLFPFNFDYGGLAAFILLSGVVVNASIYIIYDFLILQNKKKDHSPISLKLFIQAILSKSFPILLTIGSTILGLIPFISFGQKEFFWTALALSTIGGLLWSLLGIFIVLPMFFVNYRLPNPKSN